MVGSMSKIAGSDMVAPQLGPNYPELRIVGAKG